MIEVIKRDLWSQFGATIEMLENCIEICPDSLWDTESKFWYRSYHTLFYLDYYLTKEPNDFNPPFPFTLSEFDPSGILPDKTYSKEELIIYLIHCKKKCIQFITELDESTLVERFINEYKNLSRLEILLYNLRHVQHHIGQLNMILAKEEIEVPRWVSRSKINLSE